MSTRKPKDGPAPDQLPLFNLSRKKVESESTDPIGRGKAQPVYAYALCPGHGLGTERKGTGLVLASRHLMWRAHYVVLGSGASVPCRASGVTLCVLAPENRQMTLRLTPEKRDADPMHGVRTARCLHREPVTS
jgi:hypothetical protein